MTIIDAHAHIFPTKIALKASDAIGDFYGIQMGYDGTVETLLKNGGEIGVSKYLVCSTATKPEQVSDINTFIRREADLHSEFIPFATLHQDMPCPEAEIERIVRDKFVGIKLHPDFQQFPIDLPKMIPVYKLLAKYNLPVLFHTGDDRYDFSSPARLHNLLSKVPELRTIGAHFGGYREWDKAVESLKDTTAMFDTSSTLEFLTPERAAEMIHILGEDRFFFGVDYPMWSHAKELARFNRLPLSEQCREKIFSENFKRYFKID